MKHLLLTTIAANYGFSSIPWWCYLILFLFLFGFIKKRLGQTIHKHAIEGNIRAIKKLVNSKGMTCLEAKDEEGCSPLHYAAMGGHKEVAEFLIDNNAAINASDALEPGVRIAAPTARIHSVVGQEGGAVHVAACAEQ